MLSDRCLSCPVCPVCDVGVLCPNGWMNQDEIWHSGRPRSRPYCVRWRPSFPRERGHNSSNFRNLRAQALAASVSSAAHVCCGRTAGWIKVPFGTEVGLRPGHVVLDGVPAPPKGAHPQFSAHVYCGQTIAHLSYC